MSRRRGNRHWGKPLPPIRLGPTEFEIVVARLRLAPEMYTSSRQLKAWCVRNCNRCYVPEWLLGVSGIDVEVIFSEVPPRQTR